MPARDLGTVNPGSTVYIEFDSYGSNGESITLSGLLASDIEVYKDGSVTQRASDNGYTLLDTDGIDFDGTTGIHGVSISLADNSDAGFWAAGSHYRVVIASVTINTQTVNLTAATFRIGYPAAILNTTIATLSSQTSFTLTAGPAEDDALNGMWAVIHDVASAVQKSVVQILDYTGATKTVTLAAGATFTAAATDNISVMGPMPLQPATTGRTVIVGSAGAADANVEKWNTTDVPAEHTAGYPIVTVKDGTGTGEIDTASGVVLARLADGVTHGGTTALLRLGSSSSTPALHVTNSSANPAALIACSGTGASAFGLQIVGGTTGAGVEIEQGVVIFQGLVADITGSLSGSVGSVAANGITASSIAANAIGSSEIADGAITAAKIADGAIDAATFAADVDAEILSYIVDDATRIDASALNTASVTTIPAIAADNPNRPTRAVELANLIFMMFDATDGFTPEPSITVTATISKDGGAFAACTNSVSEISAGFYKITLTATEMTADSIALKFTGTGCRQTNFTFRTQPT